MLVAMQLARTLPLNARGNWKSTNVKGRAQRRTWEMLWTIFVILLVLWLLGMVSGYVFGNFIHILLVIALVVLLLNVIGGRRPVV